MTAVTAPVCVRAGDLAAESDESLAARAKEGAPDALGLLVRRHRDRIYRLALRMSRNASDAEEITQEAFLHAQRGIHGFQGGARVLTWLYRIAVNEALMRRRAARRRPEESRDGRLLGLVERADDGGPTVGADELLHHKALVGRVRAALEQLDDDQRAALVLRDLQELTAEEASDVLGISPEAVRQRAHRGRLHLRRLLPDLLCA